MSTPTQKKRNVKAEVQYVTQSGVIVDPHYLPSGGADKKAYYRVHVFIPMKDDPTIGIEQLLNVETPDREYVATAVGIYIDREYPEGEIWGKAQITSMRRSWESRAVTLYRLGVRYERALQDFNAARNRVDAPDALPAKEQQQLIDAAYERMKLAEENIRVFSNQMEIFEEGVPEIFVVRGRNYVRRKLNLEPVNI